MSRIYSKKSILIVVCFMLFNATFNNISAISWLSIFVCVEETADIFVSFALILFIFALKQLITLIVLIYFVYI
jgi:hypothetical protein